jgi:transcriptional regulator with XRE-family HTH domain
MTISLHRAAQMTKRLDPVDVIIAQNIHFHRVKKQMSQAGLARRLGITFQQIQKYENAANRVSASRLFHIARVLGIPVSAFFNGAGASGKTQAREGHPLTLAGERHAARLTDAYSKISGDECRLAILELVEKIAKS